jgi:LAO/AO transport system kinase
MQTKPVSGILPVRYLYGVKMGLAEKVLTGDVQAAARLISQLEDEAPDALAEMNNIYPHTGRAYIVGVTGPPGAGKSTLADNLIGFFRKKDMSVGVIAIDPTSALTGGAILGDRVRMQRHSTDRQVFIRSLATRGWTGGLARATIGTIHIMDAMGKDIILVETVGSGQIEIDIVRAADTTLVVLTPGAGDEIQMMKAGILEAADIFVINKADKEGADRLRTDLEAMLMMKARRQGEWLPAIVLTEAVHDKGTGELAEVIFRHRDCLASSGELHDRQRERARLELLETVEGFVRDFIHRIDEGDYLERLVDDLLQGRTTPHRAALEITGRLARDLPQLQDNDK